MLTQSYTYDAVNRLETAQEMSGTTQSWRQQFSYDACGNRRIDANPAHTTPGLVGTNPDISAETNRIVARAGESYHYDAAGNLDRDQTNNAYAYDAENRQVSYNGGAGVTSGVSYSYDGEGRRVKKVTPAGVTVFVYNVLGQLVAEYSSEQGTGNGTSYLTADTLGSTRVVTDSSGQVRARHDYLPFGEELYAGSGGRSAAQGYVTDNVRQKFTSYERDNETGLDYAQARYYTSIQGRFTSPDPLLTSGSAAVPQSWNRYVYCVNNPLLYTDPSGLVWGTWADDGGTHYQWYKDEDEMRASGHNGIQVFTGTHYDLGDGRRVFLNPDGPNSPNTTGVDYVPEVATYFTWGWYIGSTPDPNKPEIHDGGVETDWNAQFALTGLAQGVFSFGRAALGSAASRAFATESSEAVFWSGGEAAKDAATTFATTNGGKTITMTPGGRALSLLDDVPYRMTRPLWNFGSRKFAEGASGDVNVFLNGVAKPNSIWMKTELPTLMRNPNITTIAPRSVP